MASSLGSLVVSLGLDSAEFTRGLTKAELQAKQFAQNTRSAMLSIGKVLGGLAIADMVVESTKAIIAEAAALDDLADATGSSVEALSQLNNQAKISGTSFETLQNAMLKLSAGMAGTDEETSKAKEALKLLGVTTRDPAQALQEVAVKLNTYADGVNKAGLAVALFGKGGAALLPTLKDMAELGDVQATVTTKQAREAEELEKAWRRLSVEGTAFKNLVLSDLVPALRELIKQFSEGIKLAGGFGAALNVLSTAPATSTIEQTQKAIEGLDRAIEQTKANAAHPILGKLQIGDPAKAIAQFEQQKQFLSGILARQQQASDALRRQEDRGFSGKPNAPAIGGAGDRTRALKEATDEGLRYQQSLERQLQATLDLSAEEEARVVIFDALRKGQAGFTAEVQATILDMARQLDTTKALKKADEEKKKAAEEAAKAQERINDATNHAIKSAMQEVESIKAGNDQLREQIAFLKGGEEAVNRLTDAKLADVIADKERENAARRALDANDMWVAQIDEQIRLLKERQKLIGDTRLAEQLKKEAAALQEVKNLFADALVDPLTDFITGAKSAKDAFRDLINDMTRQLSRIASQNIANALFGGTTSGGADVFGVLAKLAASALTGSSSIGFSGGGSGEHFASGGTSRGGWATVGERGPELVRLPRGAQVIPNDVLMAKRSQRQNNINIHVNVPGTTTRATADQIAVQVGAAVARAIRHNG